MPDACRHSIRSTSATGAFAAIVWLTLLAAPVTGQEEPELSEGTVDAESSRRVDAQIEQRLRGLFDSIESLRTVEVAVEAGVVRLAGEVPTPSAREIAGTLAKRVEGVVAVDNALQLNRSVATRMRRALDRLASRALELLTQLPLFGVALLLAGLTFAAGRVLSRWDAPFVKLAPNPFVRDLTRQAVRLGFALAGLLVALEVLDATALIGAVLGAAGIVSLALGFAFRDLVENYIASILLSLRQPFLPSDHVRIGDHEGHVARLTSRATILLTPDGNHVRIPNSVVFKGVIENFTRKPERRFSFAVGLGVEEDIAGAQDLGCRILDEMPGVLVDPPPRALVEELGDSNVALRFFAWVDQRKADFGKVRSEAIRLVKQAFDCEEIDMPEPIQRIRLSGSLDGKEPTQAPKPVLTDRVRDVSPETHLGEEIAEERRVEGEDLLEADAPQE